MQKVSDLRLRRPIAESFIKAATEIGIPLNEDYNGAEGNADSLRIMEQAYEKLGMHDLAADARRVLELNFPEES